MKTALAALQFLTVFPLPRSLDLGERALGRSVWFFPAVGLGIGAAVAALDYGCALYLPPLPCAIITVIAFLLASGGLHIDGLADTADGFFSSRPKERILEIMKDSRSGPMAIAAVWGVLTLKAAAIAALPPATFTRAAAIALMATAGRTALVLHMNTLPYAREEGGLGTVFVKYRSWLLVPWALLCLSACGWLALRWAGLAAAAVAAVVAVLFSLHCLRKIGGFTGDTLGAVCEITEIVPALAVAEWLRSGAAL